MVESELNKPTNPDAVANGPGEEPKTEAKVVKKPPPRRRRRVKKKKGKTCNEHWQKFK